MSAWAWIVALPRPSGLWVVAVAVPLLAQLWSTIWHLPWGDKYLPQQLRKRRYQDFIDTFPTTKFQLSDTMAAIFGKSRAYMPPDLIRRFDWVVEFRNLPWDSSDPGINLGYLPAVDRGLLPELAAVLVGSLGSFRRKKQVEDPRTVLCAPHAVHRLLEMTANLGDPMRHPGGRSVVFFGYSWQLSTAFGLDQAAREALVAQLRRVFSTIYYMGNDVVMEGVRTMPTGLTEHYLRPVEPEHLWRMVRLSRPLAEAKPGTVLVAFGKWTMAQSAQNAGIGGDAPIEEMKNATRRMNTSQAILYVESHPWYRQEPGFTKPHYKGQACKLISRVRAELWAASQAAKDIGVTIATLDEERWWWALPHFRFIVSPMGDEIQSPKTVEALLTLTVPIVDRGPYPIADDLLRLGFPIAVVDEWSEVTPTQIQRWWADLAPRLVSFRDNCLSSDGYWRIITGQMQFCQ